MNPREGICAYCRERRSVSRDHVIPKSMARKRKDAGIPAELLATVPCCLECNVRKMTRKLVPPSWESKIPLLKKYIPGQWRVWSGDPSEPAYRGVYL